MKRLHNFQKENTDLKKGGGNTPGGKKTNVVKLDTAWHKESYSTSLKRFIIGFRKIYIIKN